jgi:hypothetical protein
MINAHIALSNHTKEMKWRIVGIWQVMMGVMIAKIISYMYGDLFFI